MQVRNTYIRADLLAHTSKAASGKASESAVST
jgi:hypothetical protein